MSGSIIYWQSLDWTDLRPCTATNFSRRPRSSGSLNLSPQTEQTRSAQNADRTQIKTNKRIKSVTWSVKESEGLHGVRGGTWTCLWPGRLAWTQRGCCSSWRRCRRTCMAARAGPGRAAGPWFCRDGQTSVVQAARRSKSSAENQSEESPNPRRN